MLLTAQYYRPPFPRPSRWQADLAAIAETGFDAIVVSLPWSWVEPEPGRFRYDDYDRLFEAAGARGLGVIINLWTEIQPVWIHREVPDAHMVDHTGRKVVSSTLAYMHFGVIPGGCTDHPVIRARAGEFMRETARRYAGLPNLLQWDCWNEMRWLSQTDGYVCYCPHTLARYQEWLRRKYGELDALNEAWLRRYCDWRDIVPPNLPTRTYTDSMAWQEFITQRTSEDLRWRYECVRSVDAKRPIVAHAAFPSTLATGKFFAYEMALTRGNDWELAKQVDGFGGSHFPAWLRFPAPLVGAAMESARCAAADKPYAIAELQGGASSHGLQPQQPVSGPMQARWLWSGIARGAKTVNFWCWRDEVFGRESGGFGIVGNDGFRDSRLHHLRRAAAVLREHRQLLDDYRPEPAQVGVVFEPGTYRLDWAARMPNDPADQALPPFPAGHSLQAYLCALECLQIPYDVVETGQDVSLSRYRLLVLPWPLVVDERFAQAVLAWVHAGGTLLTEAGLGSFTATGLFNYPDERDFAARLGLIVAGRRPLDVDRLAFRFDGCSGTLKLSRWLEPFVGPDLEDLAAGSDSRLLVRRRLGAGTVIGVGSFVAAGYWESRYTDFEVFLNKIAEQAGVQRSFQCSLGDGALLQWRFGSSHAPLLFVTSHAGNVPTRWEIRTGVLADATRATDLLDGRGVAIERRGGAASFMLEPNECGCHLLRFET